MRVAELWRAGANIIYRPSFIVLLISCSYTIQKALEDLKMSNCIYKPLSPNETRLLCIEPAPHYNSKIICSLIPISLTINTPTYEALSYVWKNSGESWTTEFHWQGPQTKFTIYPPTLDDSEVIPEPIHEEDITYETKGGHILCDGQKVAVAV